MAAPSYTYSLSNGATADASQVMQNYNDILNGVTDGTKDLTINALTCNGAVNLKGTVALGDAAADDITVTGSLASSLPIKTTNAFDIGSSAKGLRAAYFGANSQTANIIGNAAMAGAVTVTLPAATGTLVASGAIVNADINASAAIDGSKIVSATVSVPGVVTTGTQSFAGAKTFSNALTTIGNGSGTNVLVLNAGASSAARFNLQQNAVTVQQWEMGTGGDLSLNKDGGSTTVYLKANYTGTFIEFPSGETTFTANFNTGLSTATNNFTLNARKFGKTVTITFPECKATATATTNSWSTSAAPITSAFRPASQVIGTCCIESNNSNVYTEPGFMIINTDGTVQVVRSSNWANTTTNCGFNSCSFTYITAS